MRQARKGAVKAQIIPSLDMISSLLRLPFLFVLPLYTAAWASIPAYSPFFERRAIHVEI
jgi:hypothetical protein